MCVLRYVHCCETLVGVKAPPTSYWTQTGRAGRQTSTGVKADLLSLQDPVKDLVPRHVEAMTASVTPLALDEVTLLFSRKNHLDSSDL